MANLHLVVDEAIKQKAKVIAKNHNTNLSALVEAYLFSLVRQERGITLSKELLVGEPLKATANDDQARAQYLNKKYGVSETKKLEPLEHTTHAPSDQPSGDTTPGQS